MLTVISPGEVELWEAILTLVYMFLLIGSAFTVDRLTSGGKKERKDMTTDEIQGEDKKTAKRQLRHLVDDLGMKFVIDCGMERSHMVKVTQGQREEIHLLFKRSLGADELNEVTMQEMMTCLLPESICERV